MLKEALVPYSIVYDLLVAEIIHVADGFCIAAGEVLGGEEEPLVLIVGQLFDVSKLRPALHGLPGLLDLLRRKAVGERWKYFSGVALG